MINKQKSAILARVSTSIVRRVFAAAVLAAGASLAAFGASAQVNIVKNGGFEDLSVSGQQQTFSTPALIGKNGTGWLVTRGSVDVVNKFWTSFELSQSIDLDGTGPGTIEQNLATEVGKTYALTFKYSSHPSLGSSPASMRVTFGTNAPQMVTFAGPSTKTNMNWQSWPAQSSPPVTFTATSTSTLLRFESNDNSNQNYGIALDDVRVVGQLSLSTPVIFRAVALTSGSTYVIGRVDGAGSLPITLQAYTATSCTNGLLLNGGSTSGSPVSVTADANGYFGAIFPTVSEGAWVALDVKTPVQTGRSACLVSSADNDSWPKALEIVDSKLKLSEYIDAPGRSRWYKFKVVPGQRLTLTLSGLPADYDMAAFKDIGAAFVSLLAPADTTELTKLSAEYAPSVFSPSVFSPSVFSPSVFSPDAYAPSVFSPSVFSPSVFSPSVFSPSVFSPSVFSPSVFSPSVFSPSVFSPSVFSPSVFSPSVFSPSVFSDLYENTASTEEFIAAFSSAQSRSIIGVSATPGTGDELVVVNSWNNDGYFYVRVAGRSGAYSTAPNGQSPNGQFTLELGKSIPTCSNFAYGNTTREDAAALGRNTVILVDGSAVDLNAAVPGGGTLGAKLTALASHPRVNGVVVDVNADNQVKLLKAQALADADCPFAVNLWAEEIKRIVDSYRAKNALSYVVIVGNDRSIPFFRYADQSLLGMESGYVPPVDPFTISEGSLRGDYVLSQDAYGAGTTISLRINNYPIPGLAVGRLVETPSEIAGVIDAYLAQPVVVPTRSLVTGYDFLADAAGVVRDELAAGTQAPVDTLIAANNISPEDPTAWKATQLGQALLGATRHDLVFLAGHFSANSALAADFKTSLYTTDLAASSTDFTNAIVFSAGCHSGYNIVDADAIPNFTQTLDWVQAFAQKKATLIAGTGYQYGDTDFLEYSERIYANFTKQLRVGTGAVSVGQALVKAKLDYLASTPDIRGIHEKALLEATLFGLPMLGVDMPAAGRTAAPALAPSTVVTSPVPSGAGALTGLYSAAFSATPTLAAQTKLLKNVEQPGVDKTAQWYSGPQGVVTNPAEPAVPLASYNVTSTNNPGLVLKGVGFIGGRFTDEEVVALTGAPTDDLRGVHVPFVSPVFYPMRRSTVNYTGAIGGTGVTALHVTPVQHRASDIALGTSTLRKFSQLDLQLFYSGNLGAPSTSDAPTIVSVIALPNGPGVTFTAQVVGDPKALIHKVWVTYTSLDTPGVWQSKDLAQCTAPVQAPCFAEDSTAWKGTLPAVPNGLRYVVQAVNGYGLVTLDDNLGVYYAMGGAAQAPTTTTFVLAPPRVLPGNGTFGDTQKLTVNLKSGSTPLANKSVIVAIGGAARAGTSDVNGNVLVDMPLLSVGTYRAVASFGGDDTYLGSSASAGSITIAKAPTTLDATALGSGVVTLKGIIGTKQQPLLQEAVTFSVTGNGYSRSFVAITDYLGRAYLPPTGLPMGTYTIAATFEENATYLRVSTSSPNFTIAPQTITFGGNFAPTLTFPGGSFTFTATSSLPGSPVTVTVAPDATGAKCALAQNGAQYTLTAVALGTCTLVASAPGTVTVAPVSVSQPVAVMSNQTITFAALPDKTWGDPDFTVSATTTSPLTVTFTASGNCTVTGSTVHITSAGSCTITASQSGNTLYFAATPIPRSFNIGKATPTITFGPLPDRTYGDPDFTVSATASGGLAVTFSSQSPSCTVSGNTVHIVTSGTCIVRATVAENANYLSTFLERTFEIAKRAQTITFAPIADKALDDSPVTLTATASSGLPVTFTAAGTCEMSTLVSNQVTLKSIGSCTVTATQAGDTSYNAATAQQSFLIGLPSVWRPTGTMTMARSYHTATRLNDGSVLITGGLDQFGAPTASTEAYLPASRTFVSRGNMPSKSANHAAALLNDGKVIVLGGGNSSAQVFDPATNTWSPAGSMGSNRSYHTATTMEDGRVLIAGGSDQAGKTLNTTLIFNPVNGSFTAGPTLGSEQRERHTATLITVGGNKGKVLIVGGRSKTGNTYKTLGTSLLCSATVCTPVPGVVTRHAHAAVELTTVPGAPPTLERDLLVTGGASGNADLATSDLFDLETSWSTATISPLSIARREVAAAELPFGQALIAGGFSGTMPQAAADIFGPPVRAVTPMVHPRAGHTATTLRDSNGIVGVLVTGGLSDGGVSVKTAETYGIPPP